MNDESIFAAALQKSPGNEREAYLDEMCGDDQRRRKQIAELLASHDQSNSLLDGDLTGGLDAEALIGSTIDATNSKHGKGNLQIGSYRLLHLLGEGGMGSVYMAEQTRPVRRRVAVKIIKQGLNSTQFTARFEAERQAIAMMDHPNIAKVLDAGCTENGDPFFVMELVKGVPITDFCDQNKISTEGRLELFIQVCNAVQHAHQKGIIHRDLKPSNVMVAMYDDKAVPKVIDFGVAKATHQPLTEQTLYTVPGQIVGTWEYMSPEQAILNQLDVDTRTDIYSLGVILYELLTGHTPLDLKSLQPGALEERLRRIREEEPSRPSLRVSSLGAEAGSLATYRGTEAKSLTQSLRGDLDWIVMKAIEKDRSKRYETANGFAAEINRFLNDEPISFRPPSNWAQFGRFYRKHKVAVNAAFGTAAALLVLTCVSLYSMRQTSSALKMAHAAVYERLISAALSGDSPLTKQLLEDAREAKLDEFKLTFASAVDHYNRDEPDAAISLAESIPSDHPQFFAARALIATSHGKAGHDDKHLESLEEIRTLTPKTGEDFLYLSQAEIDRAKSLEYAKQAFQRRKSATALLCIAESMHLHANDVGNPEQARPGLRLLNAAEVYLGESTHLLAVRLATEHLLSKVTVGAERETFVARANETAKNLSVSGKNSLSWVAPLYFFDSGQFDDATSAWQGVDLRGNVLSQYIGALCLATQDDPNKALRQFDQLTESDNQNPWVRLSRIPLMRGHPKEKDNISAEMQLLRQEAGDRPELQFHLLLEMEPQSQRAYSQELLQGADGRYDAWGMHECIEFLSGDPTDKRIQQALLAVTHSSEDRCVVEYTIALRLLHEVGRRSQAIEHFTSCIDTNQWYLFVHNWAKGYDRRLENPEWPSEAWKRTF